MYKNWGFALAEGATRVDMRNNIRRCAFTLAEVLITLAIIGIVAALTIPTLVNSYKEKITVSKLKKFYSTLSQAYLMSVAENGAPDEWGFTRDDSRPLLENLTKYMKVAKICSTVGDKCHPGDSTSHKNGEVISNGFNVTNNLKRTSAVLADGTIISVYVQSADCSLSYGDNDKQLSSICGEFLIDINGGEKPNQSGTDIFIFDVTKFGIIPSGAKIFSNSDERSRHYRFETGCLASESFGWGCTGWVIENENLDYLYCDDLSWDGKTKCDKK